MNRPVYLVAAVLLASYVTVHGAPPGSTYEAGDRPSVRSVLDTLGRVKAFRETAISPDGKMLAWVEEISASDDTTAIYVRDLPSGPPRRVSASATASAQKESGVAWSHDGRRLVFLSDAATPHQLQLFTIDAAAGAASAKRVSNVTGQLAHPLWSHDGSRIAFLFVAGSTQRTGALVAYKPDSGVVGEVEEEQRIAIVDVASGVEREVSPANMFVYDYDWSPDGRSFVAEAAEGSGTNNYWLAQLYTVSADNGRTTSIWKPTFQLAWPRWSPDGRSIAVIHGIMSDEGSNGGDVYVVPAAGGAAKNVTPDFDGSARSLEWTGDGHILINEYVDGKSALVSVGASGGQRATVVSEAALFNGVSIGTQSMTGAAVVQSFRHAQEVYAGPLGTWTAQTSANAAIEPFWGQAQSLHWKTDAYTVQGFLLYPQPFDPSKKYPLVVSVHGGPSSAFFPQWQRLWNAVLPSQGYFVLQPNPRGSYGSGEAFTQANVRDFGYGDFRDILGGVDAAIKAAPIDPARVGIIGWSYGGYMTMWGVTQTNRFKAAVAGAGIANWQSYYGQNKIDTWMLPFFGASVYDKPEVYERSSPIAFIKKTKTPTLVLHGDRDSEVPTPQGYEFWHALRALGVPTELVIYTEEGHAISKPEHQRDIEERLVAWFDKYLAR